MKVKIRFFARFRELFGSDIIVDIDDGISLVGAVKSVAEKNKEGYQTIFDENGTFKEFVIVMRNGKRVETVSAETTLISDGDEIAVFPPVAGG